MVFSSFQTKVECGCEEPGRESTPLEGFFVATEGVAPDVTTNGRVEAVDEAERGGDEKLFKIHFRFSRGVLSHICCNPFLPQKFWRAVRVVVPSSISGWGAR